MKATTLLTLRPRLALGALAAAIFCSGPAGGADEDNTEPARPIPLETGPAAAPDATALLEILRDRIIERAREEAERRERFQTGYAYTLRKVTEKRDAANRLRSRSEEEVRHDPRKGTAAEGKDKGPGYRRKDFTVDRALFRRFQMTLAAEVTMNGRPTWVLDFAPAVPPAPAHGLKERFLNRVAGRVWIDREDSALARLELRLTEPVSVIGGLVGSVKACRVTVQRERVEDGLWYTRRMRWHLEGRRLFTTNVMIHEETRRDVRKVKQPGARPGSLRAGVGEGRSAN